MAGVDANVRSFGEQLAIVSPLGGSDREVGAVLTHDHAQATGMHECAAHASGYTVPTNSPSRSVAPCGAIVSLMSVSRSHIVRWFVPESSASFGRVRVGTRSHRRLAAGGLEQRRVDPVSERVEHGSFVELLHVLLPDELRLVDSEHVIMARRRCLLAGAISRIF